MKPLLLTFAAFFLSFSIQAQLDKSTWLVGGNGNFYSSKRDYVSYATPNNGGSGYSNELHLTLSPNIGYFLADRFALGLRPFFSWGKGEFFPNDPLWGGGKSDSKRYGIGPFARYYFLDKIKQYNILSEISYQVGTWNSDGAKGKLSYFNFSAGPVIFFNSSAGLELLLGYSSSSEELKGYSKSSPKGFNVSVGFQIHLLK